MAKKKVKKNDINKNVNTDDEKLVVKFIVVLIIISLIAVGFYFISKNIVKNRDDNTTESNVTISYDKVNVGMIFNRPYDEYFVMVYDSTDNDAMIYSSLISKYSQKEDSLKIYYCDLSNKLNKEFVSSDGTTNSNAKSVSEFKFGQVTLIKVRNGKIVSYIENIDTIKNTLK